jgi:hypothetical protein
MATTLEIKLLERYRIDRHAGLTADGSTQLVVLVLKASGERELAVAMSKADAMVIGLRLQDAASEAQSAMNRT